jgi:hypothetical protein
MISIPITVNNPLLSLQSRFWWASQQKVYGDLATERSKLVVVDRNFADNSVQPYTWCDDIPHDKVTGVWSDLPPTVTPGLALPLNIQVGLRQVIPTLPNNQIVEILDADCFHFCPATDIDIGEDEIFCCTVYEPWHLYSLTTNRYVIEPYLDHTKKQTPYNGGFVPILSRSSTIQKLLPDWEEIHRDILLRNVDCLISWWAGMYAFQAACSRLGLVMKEYNTCCIPPVGCLQPNHYAGHYCCDPFIPKSHLPKVDLSKAPSDAYYDHMRVVWRSLGLGVG